MSGADRNGARPSASLPASTPAGGAGTPARGAAPASALQKVHVLFANQLLTRVLTFLLNLLVVRHVGALVFGLSAVNLYLLYTTILFIAREGLRR